MNSTTSGDSSPKAIIGYRLLLNLLNKHEKRQLVFVFVLMFKFWSVSCLVNGRPTIGYNLLIGAISYLLYFSKPLALCSSIALFSMAKCLFFMVFGS